MPRIKVIVNPLAGRGHAGRMSPQIQQAFQELGADFDLVHTRQAGEAVDLASQAIADGFDTVVAVGGDGTSHEVVNGIMAQSNGHPVGTLGCIPGGSGNDFAVMSGAPVDLRKACEQIVRGETRLLDVGEVTLDGQLTRFFDNAVGIGFDGWVTYETRGVRLVRGMALYVPVVLKTIFSSIQPMRITLTTDGESRETTIMMAVICNGPREGGSFLVAPDAEFDDGLLDLSLTEWMPRLSMLGMVPRFIKGTHVHDPRVRIERARSITVASDDPLMVHVDGEILSGPAHEVRVRLLPASLRVISPS
ncbi:MAG: diacylglycerol kinase family lipid kinase [Chloroflexi bacterium]|nr:diacylglycerol kinase family lipid kinase [Chloroflexota bacterium]